jgi:hypothetical protein
MTIQFLNLVHNLMSFSFLKNKNHGHNNYNMVEESIELIKLF